MYACIFILLLSTYASLTVTRIGIFSELTWPNSLQMFQVIWLFSYDLLHPLLHVLRKILLDCCFQIIRDKAKRPQS